MLREGLVLVALGSCVGVLGAISLTHFLSSVLYRTSPTHPATLLAVVVILVVVAAVACYVPARRAARVDPVVALRAE